MTLHVVPPMEEAPRERRIRRVSLRTGFVEVPVTLRLDLLQELWDEVPHEDGGVAWVEEIPFCEENCKHYDRTRAGAEVKGKRSPCALGHRCVFRVPRDYSEGHTGYYGDYRLSCNDRIPHD